MSVPAACQTQSPPAPQTTVTTPKRDPYTPQVPSRAISYQRAQYAVGFGGLFWRLAGLILFLRGGYAERLQQAVYRWLRCAPSPSDRPPRLRLFSLYFLLFAALSSLWRLPIHLLDWGIERHFGFGNQNLGGLLGDTLLNLLFELPALLVFWGGWWLVWWQPRRWWWGAWGGLALLLWMQIVLFPVVVSPAYNRFTPLPPGPLRERILGLAAQAPITGARVWVEDTSRRTTHVNAYVHGVGPTTRIVLNDTALQTLPDDQLLAMMAHEIGHYVEAHRWWQFLSGVVGGGVFLGLLFRLLPRMGSSLSDLTLLPRLSLVIALFLLVQAPIASGISRIMERRADAYGLRLAGLSDATARLMVGFAERDYADPDPPALLHFWFGTHPTLKERIAFARSWNAGVRR